jgi:hypothetical protein
VADKFVVVVVDKPAVVVADKPAEWGKARSVVVEPRTA